MTFPVERSAALLILLFPTLLLSVRSGTNGCFLLLILLALYQIARERSQFFLRTCDNTALAFTVAMASLTMATFISQLYHHRLTGGPYDGTSRFLFAIPIFLMLRSMPLRRLTIIQYGFIGGALTALAVSLYQPSLPDERLGTYYLNVIHYGDLALILGLMSALTINWDRSDGSLVIALKIVASLAGLWISIRSGTRGGWLAVPVVAAVWLMLSGSRVHPWTKWIIAGVVVVTLAVIYSISLPVQGRVNAVIHELQNFDRLRDSSTGMRLQIWSAALHLYAQHPVFGVGPDQFASYVADLVAQGYLTPAAGELARAEVHNEILTRAVTLGVFGLASILMIYFVPLALFVRATRADSAVARHTGVIGACFVTGFFVFGLTVETFDLKATATFYSLTLAVLLAIAANRAMPPAPR